MNLSAARYDTSVTSFSDANGRAWEIIWLLSAGIATTPHQAAKPNWRGPWHLRRSCRAS